MRSISDRRGSAALQLANESQTRAAQAAALTGANEGAPGTDLTDTATQTITVSGGPWRRLPTLSQGGTLTLSTVGAVAGSRITITRTAVSANTYAIVDGGAGTPTLFTMPASKQNFIDVYFDGAHWIAERMGVN